MGLIRKTMSMTTLGAVDFRSDKERTAAYTKAAKKQAKKQTKIMEQQLAAQQAAANPQQSGWGARLVAAAEAKKAELDAAKHSTPAGWYPDQTTPGQVRYFDGTTWTNQTRPE